MEQGVVAADLTVSSPTALLPVYAEMGIKLAPTAPDSYRRKPARVTLGRVGLPFALVAAEPTTIVLVPVVRVNTIV